MATLRRSPSLKALPKPLLRSFCSKPSHHSSHQETHSFQEPNSFLGSWLPPKDPIDAQKKLALLRRDYAKQFKEVRKQYIHEMELLRIEKQRKEDARREVIRVANEERKKLKAEAAKLRAEERKVAEEEFRQALLKERAEKLESWRMKVKQHQEKKKESKITLHRQSSLWISEEELDQKIDNALKHSVAL